MSLPDTTSAFLAVLIGLFIPPLATSPHLNTLLLVSSFATMMACHFALSLMSSSGSLPEVATTVSSPIMALVMLGVAYSINPVVVWPGVAVVIHRHERAERAKKHRAAVRRRRAAAAAAAAISGATVVAEGNIALGDTDDENDDVTSVSSVDSDSGDGSRDTVLGTAYGVCTSALNVGLVVVPLCAAGVRVAAGWAGLELFYAGIAALGVLGALSLWAVDGFVEDFRARAPSC
ncbi:hypothetical protein HDU83_000197 [Entophlyctis luteolus]|nr:hypothetical protein HDU83_000197 [Entophlyctis luteolus]